MMQEFIAKNPVVGEARDLNHAVQLVSQQPGLKYGLGPVEIRPVMDLSEIIKESEQLRASQEHQR